MNRVVNLLKEAKALIDSPDKWCKGSLMAGGKICAVGAVYAAASCAKRMRERQMLDCLQVGHKEGGLSVYNDHEDTTHADMMALFDKAIAFAERRYRAT